MKLNSPPMRAARLESEKSTHRFKIGAAIAKGKKVLSKASNTNKTNPRFGSGNYDTLHAEGHAIYRAVRQGIDISGASIYVYRLNENLAKPCPGCMALIRKFGIKEVVYTGV